MYVYILKMCISERSYIFISLASASSPHAIITLIKASSQLRAAVALSAFAFLGRTKHSAYIHVYAKRASAQFPGGRSASREQPVLRPSKFSMILLGVASTPQNVQMFAGRAWARWPRPRAPAAPTPPSVGGDDNSSFVFTFSSLPGLTACRRSRPDAGPQYLVILS